MTERIDRRRFLKYAGVTAVAGATAVGGATYYLTETKKPPELVTASTSTSERTSPYYPPTIVSLTYTPTRVVNDKVYDMRVNLSLNNPSNNLTHLEVQLIPVEYPHLPKEAFLHEESRTIHASFQNLKQENLAVDFTNLKGGREYLAKVLVTDASGNVIEGETRTTYVREFENLGKLRQVSIVPFYYAWHLPTSWRYVPYSPALGPYDSHDPFVFDRHIDEITGYGMNAICIEWVGGDDWTVSNLKNNLLRNSALINSDDIEWFLLYDPIATGRLSLEHGHVPLDDETNRATILNDFEEMSEYFHHPTYRRFRDGRPYVFWYMYRTLRGDVERLIEEIREKHNLYIIGDLVYWQLPDELAYERRLARFVDMVSSYSMYLSDPKVLAHDIFLKEVDSRFKVWSNHARLIKKDFAPVTMPGYDDRLLRGSTNPVLERSTEFFRRQLDMAGEYLTDSPTVFVSTFNEGPEGTGIEKAAEWNGAYLEEVSKLQSGES